MARAAGDWYLGRSSRRRPSLSLVFYKETRDKQIIWKLNFSVFRCVLNCKRKKCCVDSGTGSCTIILFNVITPWLHNGKNARSNTAAVPNLSYLHVSKLKSKALWATSWMNVMLSLESHMLTHAEYWSINNQHAKELGKFNNIV